MMEGWEFGGVVIAHGLAVASPGPDFALVIRQSLVSGRTAAIASAVGIGCGILVHVSYSLLGIGLLISRTPEALVVLKYLGAVYLAWMGINALRSSATLPNPNFGADEEGLSKIAAWTQGFLTNVLNLKATFFFVALFSALAVSVPKATQTLYGTWMVFATIAWFTLVALVFTRPRIRNAFLRWRIWLDRLTGIAFLGFALSLAVADLS